MPRASKLRGLVNPWAVRRSTWSRLMLLCLSTRDLCEVSLVAFCEVAVVDGASFECGYPGGCGSEGLGCLVDGEPSLGALAAKVGSVV